MGKNRLGNRQQQLVDATRDLPGEYGYHGTTIRRISAGIGTNSSVV